MDFRQRIVEYSLSHYKLVTAVMVAFTLALGSLIPLIQVDTDPENMLSADEPVRVFHNRTKKQFSLSDIVVVGVINDKHPAGVFNPQSLSRIYELTEFAKSLRWPDETNPDRKIGVIEVDLLALSTVDHIGQGGLGEVKFEWLMKKPPSTPAEAMEIRDKAMNNPLLKGTVVSEDGKAVCLYVPLTGKDLSYRVYRELSKKIATLEGDEQYHITGLPVAEDTFGVEMFVQMAISAPLAMLVIFILMLFFFRKPALIVSAMIVAVVSVISTMGLLIGLGYPVHIMSSMIPIFLMPIAVVDSVHILSEFFDRYSRNKGRRGTILEVMGALFTPMLYTSLTSAAGFMSLAFTPIPPVQVFGVFVAVGIMIAWVCTVMFVPAYIMMIKEKSLENFGHNTIHPEKQGRLAKLLTRTGNFTYNKTKPILAVTTLIAAVAVYGITQIQINDNPVKWFSKNHPIRRADIELNKHFGGTYMAYLVLESDEQTRISTQYISEFRNRVVSKALELKERFSSSCDIAGIEKTLLEQAAAAETKEQLLEGLSTFGNNKVVTAGDKDVDFWYELVDFFEAEKAGLSLFKQPEVLEYIAQLQNHLEKTGLVGKSSSVADVVKKVHQELIDGKPESYIIPQSSAAVAQCLLQFQSSHNPDDLWHLVTYDYTQANIWMQFSSGDNKDMEAVVNAVNAYFDSNSPPVPLNYGWAGLTYINTVWQNKMVQGMLQSFTGSFIIVFIMMVILFRSPLWGIVCMIPLLVTIAVIYGAIGLAGKDYDMPVAVLSALTLGIAVDFAIHFLQRARVSYAKTGSWQAGSGVMFGEPARAISRNVLVIAIGFLPLLAAPLVPYRTVGVLVCAIMALSGAVTLMVLPAILRTAEERLFKRRPAAVPAVCSCAFCLTVSAAASVLLALSLHQYWKLSWSKGVLISIMVVSMTAIVCGLLSRREVRKLGSEKQNKSEV